MLQNIYQSDPKAARRYASEIERQIAARSDSNLGGDGAAPRLRFRSPLTRRDGVTEEEIPIDKRRDLEANPALKRLYQSSPLASLRMLERLRETASKLKH